MSASVICTCDFKLNNHFQVSLNPIRILKNEAEEEKAEVARMSSFIGAIAIGDLVKSTLGPKGMDKILVSSGRNAGQVGRYFRNGYTSNLHYINF